MTAATPTLADLKAQREALQAQRARAAYTAAEAGTVTRSATLRAGLGVRAAALAALDQLLEHWLLDVAGLADETLVHHAMSQAAHTVLTQLAPRVTAKAHVLPVLGEAFNRGATPRQLLTVSQWSQAHRWLRTGTNSPGPWRNELTPYLTEIMDSLSEHSSVRQVTFIKSSGVGGTEALYNWLGYVMHHLQNKDLLVVVPTLELRDRSFNPRLAKMLDETPALSTIAPTARRDRSNRGDLLEYGARARVIKAGANSPDSLRSDHLPYVICDEVDAFPWDVGSEGDPMTLIENRQRTFSRAKTYCVSTPTLEGQSRIAQLYARSDRRRFHVPCPHCQELQHLEFGGPDTGHGLKWRLAPESADMVDGKRVARAWYVCIHCGAEIEEKQKPDMLAAGRWIAQRPHNKHHRGYHLNALYAPVGLGLNWQKIAQKWIDSQGDTAELKAFVNTFLGETWQEQGDGADPVSLINRLQPYTPDDLATGLLITAGVDVQKDRLEASIVAWGHGEEAWLLDHHILPGDTTDDAVWDELGDTLRESGVRIALIDTGYNTSSVMAFCQHRAWAVPGKGFAGTHRPLVEDEKRRRQRLRSRRKKGQPIEPIGVDQAKALIYARLKIEQPGPGHVHFPAGRGFDDEYFAQLAAERLVTKVRGTRPFMEWVQLRPRNEALDCLVYALAAARLAPLLGTKLRVGTASGAASQPAEQAAPAVSPLTAPVSAPTQPTRKAPPVSRTGKISLSGTQRLRGA
jgi:phage terminase large subunit GpA-like protein